MVTSPISCSSSCESDEERPASVASAIVAVGKMVLVADGTIADEAVFGR